MWYWIDLWLNCDVCTMRLLRYLNGGLASVPWVVARNVSLCCGSG